MCDANTAMLPHAPPSPAPTKAAPAPGGENALSSPPAPPKKHVPTYVEATDDDGVLTFGRLDGKAAVEGQSLQDAFKHFRRDRRRQRSCVVPASVLKERAAARRAADPVGDNARLREKFIDKAKSYIGVPYAERYHTPGDALYGKPLYLDCCNFIRRVARDRSGTRPPVLTFRRPSRGRCQHA